MIYARHVKAAKGSGTWWRYDAGRRVVYLSFEHGSTELAVCSSASPRAGAFEIDRLDPRTWRVLPHCFGASPTGGRLFVTPAALHQRIGVDSVTLLETPEDVAIELAELAEVKTK